MKLKDKPLASFEIDVQWGDMDSMRHVNNIIYLKWVESARLNLFKKIIDHKIIHNIEISPILAWQDIKYIRPIVYPDKIKVTYDIIKIEDDRLHGRAEIYSINQNKLMAISDNILKAFNTVSFKKEMIPEKWKKIIIDYYSN
ncbi:MAG: acyl-ACP thioesterase [Flavobacteriaceae bacterium]|nr:acyl-ACP thioesterase [Flavobacteriaceae bacterium]|tara:strand:- start:7219 stop:7644 length:426 start_codon:yes stop_codon:yes gene_type:complete